MGFQVVIGPATVGGIQAGAFKIGDTAGTIDNIIQCKLYRPGSVGFVSKSVSGLQEFVHNAKVFDFLCGLEPQIFYLFQGGMSNELYNSVARVTDGIYEGIYLFPQLFPHVMFISF